MVDAEGFAHHVGDFAERGIGAGGVADEAGTYLRRVSLLAGLAVASVALGVGLLTLADAVSTGGPAVDLLGALAAVGALALVAVAARRTD